jgi:FkbM family methyltransferase
MTPRDDHNLVIYHIGGDGDYGPAMAIARRFPKITTVVVFDAREDTDDRLQAETIPGTRNSPRVIAINRCVDETIGDTDFYVNKFPLSSSLLPISRLGATEDPVYSHCRTWAENAELDHVVRLKTTTIDHVVAMGVAPPPDVISIDAQGAELRILRGANETLRSHALAVVSEIEFSEIYGGQALFDDQMRELTAMGFRFCEIQNSQHWHPGPAMGLGFHTVGEALWFRYCGDFQGGRPPARGAVDYRTLSGAMLIRLATIAFAFGRLSYVITLLSFVAKSYPDHFTQAFHDPNLKPLLRLHAHYVEHLAHYEQDHRFFIDAGKHQLERLLAELDDTPSAGATGARSPSSEVELLQAQITTLNTTLTQFQNSASWRITWPLRALKQLLRRLVGVA